MATKAGTTTRRIDGGVLDVVKDLVGKGWTAAMIRDELERREELADVLPDERQLQRVVRDLRGPDDTSGRWKLLSDEDPDGARWVLESWAAVREWEGARVEYFTKDQAAEIARLGRIAPAMPALTKFYVARGLVQARLKDVPMQWVEDLIGFAPWLDGGERYLRAFKAKRHDMILTIPGIEYDPVHWEGIANEESES